MKNKIKCPKCKEEISYLRFEQEFITVGDFDQDGMYDIDDESLFKEDFKCPECGKILFTKEVDAYNFLNPEKK